MYLTRDYLKVDPWSAIIEMINNEYGTELFPNTTHLKSFESLGGTRTKISIRTNISKSGSNTIPQVELPEYFYYDRLELAVVFKGGPIYLMSNVRLPLTSYDVLSLLENKNDIKLSGTDFVPEMYKTFNTPYTLTAAEKSLRFVGELDFKFDNTLKYNLTSGQLLTEFPNVNTWQLGNNGSKITGNYLFTGYDFTRYREELRGIKENKPLSNVQALRGLIADVTKQTWVATEATAANNLCHSIYQGVPFVKVVYNGIRDIAYTPRTDIDNVMVLELSNERCSNVSGYLLFHYN